jgi:dGTP triphosphohydrolase
MHPLLRARLPSFGHYGGATPASAPRPDKADAMKLWSKVATKVAKQLGKPDFDAQALMGVFVDMFRDMVDVPQELTDRGEDPDELIRRAVLLVQELDNIAEEGEIRTSFTSNLVSRFVESAEVQVNEKFPQLSLVKPSSDVAVQIEALKRFTYEATIASNRVRLTEYRGKEVVKGLLKRCQVNEASACYRVTYPPCSRQQTETFKDSVVSYLTSSQE